MIFVWPYGYGRPREEASDEFDETVFRFEVNR